MGYWPSVDRDEAEVHKYREKRTSQYPAILTEQAGPIKDLFMG